MELKLIVAFALIGLSAASKLSNKYLPPSSAASAGGHGGFLKSPQQHGQRPSNQYLPPRSKQHHGGGSNAGKSQHHHRQQSSHGSQIATVRSENSYKPDGSYHYAFDTANGIHRQEDGHLRNAKSGHPEQVVKGSYSYTGDDGQQYKVRYTADSGGFQPHVDQVPSGSAGSHGNRKSQGGHPQRRQHHSSGSSAAAASAGAGGHSGRTPSRQYLPPPGPSSSQSAGYSYNHPGGRKWE